MALRSCRRAMAGMAGRPDDQARILAYSSISHPHRCRSKTPRPSLIFCSTSAVREHLMSDVPLGVWLSGGVDSSTILHYAAQASSSRLRTFSISFNGRSFDETQYIRQVVEHYGTDHEQLNLSPDDDLEGAIENFAYYSDEPSADSGALPVWFLSKLCKKRTHRCL